jgi:calcineurin-like phosphoesterase family protein
MLHGHIHSRPPLPTGVEPKDDFDATFRRGYNERNRDPDIRRYDVGVDANNYRPVSAAHILEFFEETDGRYIYEG